MNKTERLKAAYEDMKNGKTIEFISDDKNYHCRCWIAKSNYPGCNKRFIFWKCFGSSANTMSLNDLRWIAKMIGHCSTYEYKIVY